MAENISIEGSVAVVTGGASGIGKGIVKAIQKLILKKLVNVYKFKGLKLITINSLNELSI